MNLEQIYYTYALCDPRKSLNQTIEGFYFEHEPFYIGQGKGDRCYDHVKRYRGCPVKVNKIKSLLPKGIQPIIVKLKENISQKESLDIEVLLIKAFGTKLQIENIPKGPLTNGTSGGTYFNHTKETKSKISESSKSNWEEQEYREKVILSIKSNHAKAEMQEKFRRFLGKHHTDEAKEKIRQSKLGKSLSNDHKIAISSSMKGTPLSEDRKKKLSDSIKNTNSPSRYKHWVIKAPNGEIYRVECVAAFCEELGISMPGLQKSYKKRQPVKKGKSKGWQVLEKVPK